MILALIMVFMTAGAAFAGVGGQGVPTYPVDVFVGETSVPVNIIFSNGNTTPHNLCNDAVSNIFHTPSCATASPFVTCDTPDPDVFSVVNADGVSIAATGIAGNNDCVGNLDPYVCCTGATTGNCNGCAGTNFTAVIDDAATGRYAFTPVGGLALGPGQFCVMNFSVNVDKLPTIDANLIETGLQTNQLVSANYTSANCPVSTNNGQPGAGQGSSQATVGDHCLHVVKTCSDATVCDGSIGVSVAVTNCGTEDLQNLSVVDDQAGTLTCLTTSLAAGDSTTCSGSYSAVPGEYTDTLTTAQADSVLHPEVNPVLADATSVLSDTCIIPPAPSVSATKECTSTLACDATSANFSIKVCNTGTVDETVTITDSDCGLSGASVGTISAGACTGDAGQPANVACTSSNTSVSGAITNTGGTVAATANGCTDTQNVPSASCTIPPAPHVSATKECTSTLACDATSADFSIKVCNTGTVAETVTITDSDCGLSGASVGTISAGACTGDAGQPANVACTSSNTSVSGAITNTGGTVAATANGCTDTQNVPSASCTIPECPCQVKITKTVALDDGSGGGVACDGTADGPFGETVTTAAGNCVIFEICVENSCTDASCQTLDTTGVLVTDTHLGITGTPATNILNFGTLAPGDKVCKDIPGTATAPACTGGTSGTACVCSAVEGLNTATISSAVCETTSADACDQTGSVCSDTASVACTVPTACRMTGGHNNSLGSVDAEFDGILNKNGRPTAYTTGGQIGAPSAVGCCDFPAKKAPCVAGLCSAGPNIGNSCESDQDCPNTGRQSSCPWGDWEHSHHGGPDDLWVASNSTGISDGSFNFHSGTAAAPDIAFIHNIICEDPGWCVQARPAPDKQIFWEGTGIFQSTTNGSKASPIPQFLNCPSQPVPWSNKTEGTISYYRAHVGDFGEPAGTNQKQPPQNNCEWSNICGTDPLKGGVSIWDCQLRDDFCPFTPEATNEKFTALHPLCLAQNCGCDVEENNCTQQNTTNGCPDWYEIEIHCGVNPSALTGLTPSAAFELLKNQPVAYKVAHFITEGNFQLHPQVGSSCNPSCGNGVCEPGVLPGTGETCANCPADCGICPPPAQ